MLSHIDRFKNIEIVAPMKTVNLVLLPVGLIGVFIFGLHVLALILAAMITAVLTEAVFQKIRGQKIMIRDGSALMTGLLLAYTLSPRYPLGLAMLGSFFAIAIGKQAFGGFGRNLFNPALAGRAFLAAFWPKAMNVFTKPFVYDAVTQATPLSLYKQGKAVHLSDMGLSYWDLLIGNRSGCLGEICVLALLCGGLYLLYRRVITAHIPASFILTVGVGMWIFGSSEGFFKGDFLFQVLSGGLWLGAIFMATDPVTSPKGKIGQIVFGLGCGLLTVVIRRWGGYSEGVCYAILLMNAAVPLINRFIPPQRPEAARVDN